MLESLPVTSLVSFSGLLGMWYYFWFLSGSLLQLTMQLNQNQTNPHLCKTSSEKRGVRNEMKAKGREVCSYTCCVVFCTVSLLLKHKHTKNSYLRDLLRKISDTWRP